MFSASCSLLCLRDSRLFFIFISSSAYLRFLSLSPLLAGLPKEDKLKLEAFKETLLLILLLLLFGIILLGVVDEVAFLVFKLFCRYLLNWFFLGSIFILIGSRLILPKISLSKATLFVLGAFAFLRLSFVIGLLFKLKLDVITLLGASGFRTSLFESAF